MDPEVVPHYLDALYHRCFRMLRNHDLAWDAVQEVMTRYCEVAAHKNIHEPLHFLYHLSTNHCIDLLRRHFRLLPVESTSLHALFGTCTSAAEESLDLQSIQREFGDEVVQLLVYRHLDGMTYQEIGKLCELSDRGVKKRLDKVEAQIRERFASIHEE